jgi:hypothetical protein
VGLLAPRALILVARIPRFAPVVDAERPCFRSVRYAKPAPSKTATPPSACPTVFRKLSSTSARSFGLRIFSANRSTCCFGNHHHNHQTATASSDARTASPMVILTLSGIALADQSPPPRPASLGGLRLGAQATWARSGQGARRCPATASRCDRISASWARSSVTRASVWASCGTALGVAKAGGNTR